ncbi:MAG: hypothetical protein JRH07_01075 [Deltaproteobacteria bacterium]|nr:hypothetical protein [Deltaproteobacteria bacterium]MBW2120424.1 hypothetical protein [Deltaproteobacteria bacterium]
MTEYQTFVRRFSDLHPGKHVIFIKDLTPGPRKYDTRLVLAELSDRGEDIASWDRLWLRSEAGRLSEHPWAIRILKEMGETIRGRPYEDVFSLTRDLTARLTE